jgi:hypothetical protein
MMCCLKKTCPHSHSVAQCTAFSLHGTLHPTVEWVCLSLTLSASYKGTPSPPPPQSHPPHHVRCTLVRVQATQSVLYVLFGRQHISHAARRGCLKITLQLGKPGR